MRSDIDVPVAVVHVEHISICNSNFPCAGSLGLPLCPTQAQWAFAEGLTLLINEGVHMNQELLPTQLSAEGFLAREDAKFSLI